jgi:tRNA(Ile2) C34 agmatinyltransferase TiaS
VQQQTQGADMSTVKPNELESCQAYYREPRARKSKPRCPGCGERLSWDYEDGEKCDDCIEVERELLRRQKELEQ